VVTVVLSFMGFSTLLGGGIAGYLQDEPPKRGARVGAISVGIAVLPVVLVRVLGFVLYRSRRTYCTPRQAVDRRPCPTNTVLSSRGE
jgi:hypothetical protein